MIDDTAGLNSGTGISRSGSRGYTLLELLVVIAIVALLGAITIPPMQEMIERNAREAVMMNLRSSLALARTEAVTQYTDVSVCRSVNQTNCAGSATADWDDGWLVFTDAGTAGTVDGNDEILEIRPAGMGKVAVTLADGSNGNITDGYLQFDSEGFLVNSSNGAYFKFCDPDNTAANSRAIWIMNTGRASFSQDDADGVHNDMAGNNLGCP